MSSSLIKANFVNNTAKDGKRVIDSNQAVFDRLKLLNEILDRQSEQGDGFADDFVEGLDATQVSALFDDSEESVEMEPEPIAPSFSQEDIDRIIAEAQAEANQIINDAKAKADGIIADANTEAQQIKSDAFEQGHQEGQEAGYQDGLARTQEIENELNDKFRLMQEEYDEKISELEPRFVELLTDIYSHVFSVDLSEKSELVLFLLRNTIRGIDGGNSFFIHVSKDDYEYVATSKEQLMSGLASTCVVEVIEDITLAKSECFIETESGIFDCSLGIELANLKKELTLLSYKA